MNRRGSVSIASGGGADGERGNDGADGVTPRECVSDVFPADVNDTGVATDSAHEAEDDSVEDDDDEDADEAVEAAIGADVRDAVSDVKDATVGVINDDAERISVLRFVIAVARTSVVTRLRFSS